MDISYTDTVPAAPVLCWSLLETFFLFFSAVLLTCIFVGQSAVAFLCEVRMS